MTQIHEFKLKESIPSTGEVCYLLKAMNEVYDSYDKYSERYKELRVPKYQPTLYPQLFTLVQCVEVDIAYIQQLQQMPRALLVACLTGGLGNQDSNSRRKLSGSSGSTQTMQFLGYFIRDGAIHHYMILASVAGGFIAVPSEQTPDDKEILFLSNNQFEYQPGGYTLIASNDLIFRKVTAQASAGAFVTAGSNGMLSMTSQVGRGLPILKGAPEYLKSEELNAFVAEQQKQNPDYIALYSLFDALIYKTNLLLNQLAIEYFVKLPFTRSAIRAPFALKPETLKFFSCLEQQFKTEIYQRLKFQHQIHILRSPQQEFDSESKTNVFLKSFHGICRTNCNGLCEECINQTESKERKEKKYEKEVKTEAQIEFQKQSYENYKEYLQNVAKFEEQLESVTAGDLCAILEAFAGSVQETNQHQPKQAQKKEIQTISPEQTKASKEQAEQILINTFKAKEESNVFIKLSPEAAEVVPIYMFLQTFSEHLGLARFTFLDFYTALVQGTNNEGQLLKEFEIKPFNFQQFIEAQDYADLSDLVPLYNGQVNTLLYQVIIALVFDLYKDLPQSEPEVVIYKNQGYVQTSRNRKKSPKSGNKATDDQESTSDDSSDTQSVYESSGSGDDDSSSGYTRESVASDEYEEYNGTYQSTNTSETENNANYYYSDYSESSRQNNMKSKKSKSGKDKQSFSKSIKNNKNVSESYESSESIQEIEESPHETLLFESYKDLGNVQFKPLKFNDNTPILGARDGVWIHQLLCYISRTSLSSRDMECFSFVLPLLSLLSREVLIDQLLMNTERGQPRQRHIWDAAYSNFGEVNNKYPVAFYNEFFKGKYKYIEPVPHISEQEDIDRLYKMNRDIDETFLANTDIKFQQLDIKMKLRFFRWLINQVLECTKLNNYINSLETEKDKIQQQKKNIKSEVQIFQQEQNQLDRKKKYEAEVEKINQEISILKNKIEKQLRQQQQKYAKQNQDKLVEKENQLKEMTFKSYEQALLREITDKQYMYDDQLAQIDYVYAGFGLGSDILDNQYYMFNFSKENNILMHTINNEYYVLNNDLSQSIIRWCQDIDLITQLQKLNPDALKEHQKPNKNNAVLSFDDLMEMNQVDSGNVNDFLKGFDQLPLYCRYMLKQKGPRNIALGEKQLKALEKYFWPQM